MTLDPQHPDQAWVDGKRAARIAKVDALPDDIRALANEYGYHVVHTMMSHGVTKARSIRHLVETVLDEFRPTRGSFSKQGRRTEVVGDRP